MQYEVGPIVLALVSNPDDITRVIKRLNDYPKDLSPQLTRQLFEFAFKRLQTLLNQSTSSAHWDLYQCLIAHLKSESHRAYTLTLSAYMQSAEHLPAIQALLFPKTESPMNLMKYLRSPKKSLREQALSSIEKGDLNEWASEELWLIG